MSGALSLGRLLDGVDDHDGGRLDRVRFEPASCAALDLRRTCMAEPEREADRVLEHVYAELVYEAEAGLSVGPLRLTAHLRATDGGLDVVDARLRVTVSSADPCPTLRGTLDALLAWYDSPRGREVLDHYPSQVWEAIALRVCRLAMDEVASPIGVAAMLGDGTSRTASIKSPKTPKDPKKLYPY